MKDLYFYPSTVDECHKSISGILHTNATQATELGHFKALNAAKDLEIKAMLDNLKDLREFIQILNSEGGKK